MGRIYQKRISKFDGGMVADPRTPNTRYAQLVQNFDAHTFPYKLQPFRDSENGDSSASTSKKENFCIALRSGTTYSLYALGVVSGTSRAEILYKDLTSGGTNDLGDATWLDTTNHQSASGATNLNLFVYYKNRGRIYGAKAGTTIWAYDPSGNVAFNDSEASITYTNIAQGLVHSKDDILYIPYDNKIAKNNAGSWTTTALILPEDRVITSICEYGNFLAIGTSHTSGAGKSIVYLWDRDATVTTLSESIEWGEGDLRILENLDGYLVGISRQITSSLLTNKLIFRYYAGGPSVVFKELVSLNTTSTALSLLIAKQKVDNRLYFLASIKLNGTLFEGLWKVGQVGGEFTVTFDRAANNNTALTSGTLEGFFIFSDFVFIAYTSNSTYAVSKTNDQQSYTANSIFETVILNGGDVSWTKKLISVGVMTEALPSTGSPQVVLKYKKDSDTSFTTIFTHTTAGTLYHEAINIESSGATLPTFKEITFRIEVTGGGASSGVAVPVIGIKYKYEFIDDELTE